MSAKDRRKATVAARLTATGTVWTLAEVLAEAAGNATLDLAAAEHLGIRRLFPGAGGDGERLGLEGKRGQAQPVRHRVTAAIEVRGPQLAPEPDLRAARLGGGPHQPPDPLVGVVHIRPHRDRLQA